MTLPAAIASFCTSPAPAEAPRGAVDAGTDIPTTSLLYDVNSPFLQALRCTMTTEAQWNALWSTYGRREEAPKVDFAAHTVLFASMGEHPSTEHSIRIERVLRLGDTTHAQVRLSYPQSESVGAAMTEPVAAVLVPRDVGRVVFVE